MGTDYESQPITRQEYISAIVHLYRGELARATAWRLRLDTTTNWAVLTTAGLLAFSFREGKNSHWSLLIGLVLVTLLLGFEARRYRIFDVWRARVRKIEENFYGPILRRDPASPQESWGIHVADDLLLPRFKIGFRTSVRARLLRNYWAIYLSVIAAWVLKILAHPEPAHTWEDVKTHLSEGLIPWWVPLAYVGCFIVGILYVLFVVPPGPASEDEYWPTEADEQDAGDLPMLDV